MDHLRVVAAPARLRDRRRPVAIQSDKIDDSRTFKLAKIKNQDASRRSTWQLGGRNQPSSLVRGNSPAATFATKLITRAPVTDLEDLSETRESLSVPMLGSATDGSPLRSMFVVSELLLPLRGLALLLGERIGERGGDLLGFPSFPYRIPLCGTTGTSDLFRIHLVPHALQSTAASGGPRLHCGDSWGFMQ